ncbi:MAG: caspase family protein, partial [Muribaculaceae bacterium]|nr:caspase family protein [Muribaculaceae bacterium]
VPFFNTIIEMGAAEMTNMKLSRSFDEFASLRIKDPVESWQRKKDYETMAQWETRVNDANRKKMIDEAIAEARNEYIKVFAPPALKGTLEEYNAEYAFYPVFLGSLGNVYASVPAEEAENFSRNWDKVEIKPLYGILDNSLAVLSCTFMLDGKEYKSASSYAEDELASLTLNITPLAAVREYEQMMASGALPDEPVRRFDPDVIDIDIPSTTVAATNTFAVVIGNESYHRVAPVDYAMNDARIFAKYCSRTLGIPEDNVRTYYNATFGDFVAAIDDITAIAAAYKGDINVIFYYAGHGMPDESNRNAYLIPIDATGTQPEVCYPLGKLYEQLGQLKAKSVVAFIDACFSGSLRGDGMLASARGIRLRPKEIDATGNMVVLSAASGDQAAFPYHEKSHGLFSYYLLKKLNDTKGDVTLGDLADFVTDEVSRQSIVVNKKQQVPNVKWSANITDSWKKIRLRE